MPIRNQEIARLFAELADFLEIDGANPFRVRAYRNAARCIGDLGGELHEQVAAGADLTAIEGIGKDLAEKLKELVETGRLPALEAVQQRIPPSVSELLKLPGLGPKRVKVLFEQSGIDSLEGLAEAAEAGKLRELPGLGEKTEANLLQAIRQRADAGRRFLRAAVAEEADAVLARLKAMAPEAGLTVAGSYRRGRETVGDLDILAVSERPAVLMDALVTHDEVREILSHGAGKTSVLLRSGLQVDLRAVEAASYGAALHYFTGSKAHNIAIRRRAQQLGLKVNEYGVSRDAEVLAGATEEEVFLALGLAWIPPELREDRGEIEAAEAGELPELVTVEDIRGDLHTHSVATDGVNTIAEMAEAACARGYAYMAVTDHSRRLAMVNGLDEARLLAQLDEVDALNAGRSGFTILKGIEVDILEDGALDLPDEVLCRLDLVVGSVHSKFNLGRERQTERVLRAMDRRHFSILGHPTGRLLLSREAYDIDIPRVIEHARQRGCFLELNANPQRLDLNDTYCRMARDAGVLVSINTDAHHAQGFANIAYGVSQARRGWLSAAGVLNTRPLDELRRLLRSTMK